MRLIIALLFFCIGSAVAKSQISYSGSIDKYPIHLITYIYSDGDARAFYAYDKYDTPIELNGILKDGKLDLFERNAKGEVTAFFHFDNYNALSYDLTGSWTQKAGSSPLLVRIKREFDLGKDGNDNVREIIQSESLDNYYFKLMVEAERVCGVKILEKKTDRFIQKIDLDCQLWGLSNIAVDDYNFDGLQDFSVFESSYAGPNTSSIYILRVPGKEEFMVSEFSGTSLEFDYVNKLIYEYNQCCAGREHMNATYKVVNNKMVLVEKHCYEYDEEKDDFIEKDCN